ncbi:MAG TPA: bifunctional glutamate N-acetyltransferase/amino-acid acetyltransferase ArgJ [Candidatus Limnocylindrales bacterium]|jgi:glutamate N-acetyltransferase/amino-acid N-acetyltransferase|nr:bifunctional glutamate N-acetyltransferase/amino-acid acetyltransferase ArgJ [Candidatus Limnocylindrales bacterium]
MAGAGLVGAATVLPGTSVPVEERALMPAGYVSGGLACGIKESGRPDLAVVATTTEEPAAAAATFTRNRMAAAPVRLARAHLAATGDGARSAGRARAVIVTSGCANAATGPDGEADQAEVARMLADRFGCPEIETLVASTGLIGTRLPLARVRAGLERLVPGELSAEVEGLEAAARAIQTTDSRLKAAGATLALPDVDGVARSVTVAGISKGVGMIHPRMATMIAIVLTDATAAPPVLADLLLPAVAATFNQLTVDGDTSTNDTVFFLANGAAGAREVAPGSREAGLLGDALSAVCRSLARQQAADGEGATALLTCRVTGARDVEDARAVARAVVGSSLFKAAVHGRDPNWGRVAAAAGAASRRDGEPVALAQERLSIGLCGTPVFLAAPLSFDREAVRSAMEGAEVLVELDLGQGEGAAEAFGCDLSEEYVRENSEYST